MMVCSSKVGVEITVNRDKLYARIGELPKGTALTRKDLIALFDEIALEKDHLVTPTI